MMTDQPLQTQKRLFGNTALLSGAGVLAQLANFVFIVCLARVFGLELLGLYAFAMATGALLTVLVSFGTHTYVLRNLSREPEKTAEVTGALLVFQTCVGLLLILAVHLVARWLGAAPEVTWVVTMVVSFHVLSRLSHLLVQGFKARQEMAPVAAAQAAPRIAILLLGGIAMSMGASAGMTMASMPLAALLTLAATGWYAARRFGRPQLRLRRAEIFHYLRQGLPIFYFVALTTLYARLGIVYVTLLAGEAEAGLFASAERLVVAAGLASLMFSQALFPVIARLFEQDRERFREMVQRAGRMILFLTLPVATLLAVFAADIVQILFGGEFSGAAPVLLIVAWLLVLRGMVQLLAAASLAADCQRALVASNALAVTVLTLGSIVLLPTYGAIGLAAVLLASELSAALLNYRLLRRAGVRVVVTSGALRVALACLLAAGLAYLASDLALWLRVGVVTVGGLAGLWGFGAVRSNDLAYLRTILNSSNGTSAEAWNRR